MIAEVLYGRLEVAELLRKIAEREREYALMRAYADEIKFLRNLQDGLIQS